MRAFTSCHFKLILMRHLFILAGAISENLKIMVHKVDKSGFLLSPFWKMEKVDPLFIKLAFNWEVDHGIFKASISNEQQTQKL